MALSLSDFESDALSTLMSYGEIPCLSPMFDSQWIEHGYLDIAINLLADWAKSRRFAQSQVTIHRLEGRTPVLTVTIEATGPVDGTVVLYGHLDKQPPLGDWSPGLEPFRPSRQGDRLFARGLADDGYSTFSALLALEQLEADGIEHGRCVVLIEASEESGSPDLDAHLDALSDLLGQVELLICLDSGALTYDRLWVTTSLRGVINVEVTVRVLEQGQHSGSASGVVPSSFRILRQLLDRVEDASTGEILVEELRAIIPDEHVRAAHDIAEEFGDIVARELPVLPGVNLMGDSSADRILRRSWSPTLSIVGMSGVPDSSIAGNVLRPFTTAVLSFRLPPSVNAELACEALMRVLSNDIPSSAIVELSSHAADGWVAPVLAPWLDQALSEASIGAFGHDVGFTGEGGSIPFLASLGKRYPDVQFVATGVLGPGSNAHGIDEMLDLPMMIGVTNAVSSVVAAFARHKRESA